MQLKTIGKFLLKLLLVFVVAVLTRISFGNTGYFQLSDLPLVILIADVSISYSFLFAGLPVALADIVLGYSYLSLSTFIIYGLTGVAIAFLNSGNSKNYSKLFFILLANKAVLLVRHYLLFGTTAILIALGNYLAQLALTFILLAVYHRYLIKD